MNKTLMKLKHELEQLVSWQKEELKRMPEDQQNAVINMIHSLTDSDHAWIRMMSSLALTKLGELYESIEEEKEK